MSLRSHSARLEETTTSPYREHLNSPAYTKELEVRNSLNMWMHGAKLELGLAQVGKG